MYPIEEAKSDKFRDGLHVSLRGKLNLYTGTTFRGWVEKAMEQERLDKELEFATKVKSINKRDLHDNLREVVIVGDPDSILIREAMCDQVGTFDLKVVRCR